MRLTNRSPHDEKGMICGVALTGDVMSSSVLVSENAQGRYQQVIRAGQHQWIADEPEHLGGSNTGPAPFDFLMAALGSCTSMTLRMYAERKNIALRKISVALEHERIEVDSVSRDHIRRTINLEGNLSPAQQERLLEIANKCPVFRTLSQPVLISSSLLTKSDHPIQPMDIPT